LEKWSAENNGVLTESQVQALEQAKEEKEVKFISKNNPVPKDGPFVISLFRCMG
jgi:hypothetical protein